MQTPKTNRMETVPVKKLLLSISLPVMFSMIIQALYNIVDSIFIARFSEKALSAVSLTFPMQTLMIAVSIGTCIGINAFLSRSLGEQNFKKVRSIVQHGVVIMLLSYLVFLIIGVFFTEKFFTLQTNDAGIINFGNEYMSTCLIFSMFLFGQQLFEKLLQANGRAFLSMISQLIGAVVNIILDPILIFGLFGVPSLGAGGAAIATVIGQLTAFFFAFMFNQRKNKDVRFTFSEFKLDLSVVGQIYKIGLPAIIIQSVGSVTNFLMNGILLTFSSAAVALYGVYFKLQNFIFMPVYGLCAGLLPLMSYNIGAKQKKRVDDTLRYSMIYMGIIMLAGTLIFQIFPSGLLSMFDISGEMKDVGIFALRIISTYFVFEGFCIISQTGFQALGKGAYSLIICLIRQVVVLLPVAYVLSLKGDLSYVWFAFPLTGIVSFVICLLLWRK